MILEAPILFTPKPKLNWRDKIRRRPSPSPRAQSNAETPRSRVPSLSNSPSNTPGSTWSRTSTPRGQDSSNDVFLTGLDVLDIHSINEFDLLKDGRLLQRGSLVIPPPPPKNKAVPQFPAQNHRAGPKVRPFVTHSVKIEPRLSECFICHESLETKLETEKLVPLSCGDCVHSECLHISAIFSLEKAISTQKLSRTSAGHEVKHVVMPVCTGKKCQLEQRSDAVRPLEEVFTEELLSEAMLSLKLAGIPRARGQMKIPRFDLFESAYCSEPEPIPFASHVTSFNRKTPHPAYRRHTPDSPTPHSFPSPDLSVSESPGSLVYANRESQFFTRQNYELCSKPGTGSPKGEKSSFLRKSFSPGSLTSLEEMRNVVIKHMLHAYDIDLGLLTSLGSLKLVDRLLVSLHDRPFSSRIVYLFTDFLVVGHDSAPYLFPLKPKFSLTTPETTVLQFESSEKGVPTLKLHCEVNRVIEKWGIAVSDTNLSIPVDLVTSTISMDELRLPERAESPTQDFYAAFSRNSVANRSSRDVDAFEKELISHGLVPALSSACDSETSPLHIVRRPSSDIPVVLSYSDTESDSDSDVDSDSELISKLKNRLEK